MAYYLGIDSGTTFTAAAVWRDGRAEIVTLGNRAPMVPSVVLLREGRDILVGDAAVRRATAEPHRVARGFKRRIGDPTPLIVDGVPYSAATLTAKLLHWVVDRVTEAEGGPPAGITVSHPANWGGFKQDVLHQALELAELPRPVDTITEPEAAAIHYASQERVLPGTVLAVYDLGGGTFDAAVLRKAPTGFEILGQPHGVEHLGGVDFDEAVYRHVAAAVGRPLQNLDPDDPAVATAVARLRQECVDAKEALSADADAVVPVWLPDYRNEVRVTRGELERMVHPVLTESVQALRRALRAADVEPTDLTTVLLVGGSSRIPLVAELVGTELGRPVAVDAHPKYGVALGAAMTAADRHHPGLAPPSPTPPSPAPPPGSGDAVPAVGTEPGPVSPFAPPAPPDVDAAAASGSNGRPQPTRVPARAPVSPRAAEPSDPDGPTTPADDPVTGRHPLLPLLAVVGIVAVLAVAMLIARSIDGDDTAGTGPGGAPLDGPDPGPAGTVDGTPSCPAPTGDLLPDQPFAAGDPPTRLEVEVSGDGYAATVRWDDPNDGRNPYLVFLECRNGDGEIDRQAVKAVMPGEPTEATFDGLSLDHNYCYTVAVMSPDGAPTPYRGADDTHFRCTDQTDR